MADPTDPVAQINAQVEEAQKKAQDLTSVFGQVVDGVKQKMSGLSGAFNDIQRTMDANQQMTQNQANTFGFLATQIAGVSLAFEGFKNIDTSGLNTMDMQVEKLKNSFKEMPLYQNAYKKIFDEGESAVKKSGLVGNAFSEAMERVKEAAGKAGDAVYDQILLYAKSVGGMERMREAMVQLSSQSGNLGDVWRAMDSGNLNEMVNQQATAIRLAGDATHKTQETMVEYYSLLGTVPQALKTLVDGTDGSTKSTSMLVATTELATGTGRSYAQVIDDIKTAYDNYKLTGNEALQFTARMSELSTKFNVELGDVRSTIIQTSNAFRMFGNEGEGVARVMNDYIGAFEKTGISGSSALNLIGQLTKGIEGMTIQQKAFLSGQTGGPGGLLGGFQIEQMFREDKLDQVFEKVRDTMKKQLGGGKFMGLEDVKTEGDAQQFQKQVMMLQQGPLGKFAQDPQSAYRILEGFRNKDEGRSDSKDLSSSIVQDTMGKGAELNALTNNAINESNQKLEDIRNSASQIYQLLNQSAFTQGVGMGIVDEAGQNEMRTNLKNEEAAKMKAAGSVLTTTGDQIGATSFNSLKDFMGAISGFGPALKSAEETIMGAFKSGDSKKAQEEFERTLKSFDNRTTEAKTLPEMAGQKEQLERIAKEKETFEASFRFLKETSASKTTPFPMDLAEREKMVSPGMPSLKSAAFTDAKFPDVHLRDIGMSKMVKEEAHGETGKSFPGPNITAQHPTQPKRYEVHFSGEVSAKEAEITRVVNKVVEGIMSDLQSESRATGSKISP